VYATYYTHQPRPTSIQLQTSLQRLKDRLKGSILAAAFGYTELVDSIYWRWIGRLASFIPPLKNMVGQTVCYLFRHCRGKLLDIGCGNGEFLSKMQNLGWDTIGVEPDEEAVKAAIKYHDMHVIHGTLEQACLPTESMDAVVMDHIIEHVHDPGNLLNESWWILRKCGRLVIVTPNIESLGHKLFRQSWFPLDPPRHLCLFSLQTLRNCVEKAGFQVEILFSSSKKAREEWKRSYQILHKGRCRLRTKPKLIIFFLGWIFQIMEECIRWFSIGAGEELLLVARKPNIPKAR
jgi:2-polyprenyl-3-methyl-5-hydroxy-6-metoxy-1,4-benzoquinol methylase